MVVNVHAGHAKIGGGAIGAVGAYLSESVEDRKVKDKVIELLRANGVEAHDCTEDNGTANAVLKSICSKANARKADLDVSIHFNSSSSASANGTEVLIKKGTTNSKAYAQNILNSICALGFRNRGVKENASLYYLNHVKNPALLIECCFVGSETDAKLYNYETMANAIVSGILNKAVTAPNKPVEEVSTPTPTVVSQPTQNVSTGSSTLLQRGSRGEEVKKLQTMLNAVGYNCGKADGIFGSGTKSALVNFQKAHGLTADGIYGAKSRAKLEEVYNCKPSEVKPQQTANTSVVEGQKFLCVTADGIVGTNTRKAYARYVQSALNADYSAGLAVDGIIGNATIRALGNHYVKNGERQNLVKVVQCGLSLLGYSVNGIDGIFGSGLESAVRTFQASRGLSADGIAGKNTIINIWKALGVY